MKKLFLTLALVATAAFAHGQGTIAFANGPTVRHQLQTAPGSSTYANVPLGAEIRYGIFVGTSADNLTLVSPTALASATSAGQMQGVAALYGIPNFAPGSVVFAQVRAWDSTFGDNWQEGLATGRYRGQTDVRQLEPLGAVSGPATVIWQGSTGTSANRFFAMRIEIVPEPSTIALGVLGLGSLLLFRRRQAAK